MKIISIDQIIKLHEELINETGGSTGIKDYGMLESAISTPFQSFAGNDLYSDIED